MPRERDPKRDAALKLWLEADDRTSLKDIAEKLNVPLSRLRNWKRYDNWNEIKDKIPGSTRRKQGAPKGNKNAEGHGAPPGNKNGVGHGAPLDNKNSFVHGAFERFAFEYMEDDEKEVAQETGIDDVEQELLRTLAFLKARELRLMKRIKKIRDLDIKYDMMISSVSKVKSEKRTGIFTEDEDGNLVKEAGTGFFDGERLDTTTTNTSSKEDALNRLEAELDKVQGQKIKVLAQLDRMKMDRERLEIERLRAKGESEQSKLANEWVEALLAITSGAAEDEDDE